MLLLTDCRGDAGWITELIMIVLVDKGICILSDSGHWANGRLLNQQTTWAEQECRHPGWITELIVIVLV